MSRYGTNAGHGHVWVRPDGVKARCLGPGSCAECDADKEYAANYLSGAQAARDQIAVTIDPEIERLGKAKQRLKEIRIALMADPRELGYELDSDELHNRNANLFNELMGLIDEL